MSAFDSLNLRPKEKRLLVSVLAGLLMVLSLFWVWPRAGQWRKALDALDKSRKTLQTYEAEIARIPDYEARMAALEGQGSAVLQEEQALQLLRTIQLQAQQFQVVITSTRTGIPTQSTTTSTNAFFDEQAVQITVSTGERELVRFLHALGSGESMIRVRDMDLRPDPPRYRLNGTITLVASYQKKPKGPRAAPAPATAATAPPVPASTARTP